MKQEHLAKLNESFAHLQALEAQRSVLLAELHMWHQVMMQGIDSDNVKSIGWSLQFVQKERFDKEPWYGEWIKKSCRPLWYNYVTLKDGTKQPLNPFIKAPQCSSTPLAT